MRQPNLACDTMPVSSAAAHRSHPFSLWGLWLAIFLAIAPFIVRRVILLGDDNYLHWMAFDYLARCISLIGVILGFCSGHALIEFIRWSVCDGAPNVPGYRWR